MVELPAFPIWTAPMDIEDRFSQLSGYLSGQQPGPLPDQNSIAKLLAAVWEDLSTSDQTKMTADKLWRMESPTWEPPHLRFVIERHGAMRGGGSGRAELHTWEVDVERRAATLTNEGRRQIVPMDARFDVRPIVAELVEAILVGNNDQRLKWNADGITVQLIPEAIVPATNQQTTAARRKRLRACLTEALAPHGWIQVRPNVFTKDISTR